MDRSSRGTHLSRRRQPTRRADDPRTVHRVHRHPKGPTAEHNHPDDLHHFFESVSRELQGAERVLVVGPSTAKFEFIRYTRKHDATLEPRIVGVETVDHPTDGQLVAYARRYFLADDRMQGHQVRGTRP